MKKAFATWKWSLGVVARSPLVVGTLAAIAALWSYGAYQWLWLPESSLLLLILALLWGVVQIAVAVGVVAGTAASTTTASATGATRLSLRRLIGFSRRQYARALGSIILAGILVLILHGLFALADERALEVASFLTFHSERAVSPATVGKVFWVIEWLLWIAAWGFLLSLFLIVRTAGWGEARRRAARTLKDCCWRAPFFTSLLTLLVFGGLAWLLSTWHPKAPVGFWDYAQMLFRMGVSLVLITIGWLFWMLSVARLNQLPHQNPKP
jgi:hypothetical protein